MLIKVVHETEVDTSEFPDHIHNEALRLGVIQLMKQGRLVKDLIHGYKLLSP